MGKHNAPAGPFGPGPHPTPEQSMDKARSFDEQWAESRDRNTNPPAPDTDDMRGGNPAL